MSEHLPYFGANIVWIVPCHICPANLYAGDMEPKLVMSFQPVKKVD